MISHSLLFFDWFLEQLLTNAIAKKLLVTGKLLHFSDV